MYLMINHSSIIRCMISDLENDKILRTTRVSCCRSVLFHHSIWDVAPLFFLPPNVSAWVKCPHRMNTGRCRWHIVCKDKESVAIIVIQHPHHACRCRKQQFDVFADIKQSKPRVLSFFQNEQL